MECSLHDLKGTTDVENKEKLINSCKLVCLTTDVQNPDPGASQQRKEKARDSFEEIYLIISLPRQLYMVSGK